MNNRIETVMPTAQESKMLNTYRLNILSFIFCTCVFVLGCQPGQRSMEVVIEGAKGFPSELVGIWKTQDGKWEIEFLADGSIREALVPMGEMRLRPGETERFEMPKYEGRGEYTAGQWSVFWTENQSELGVVIIIDHFYQDVGNDAIEGRTADYIFGKVSEDFQVWTAELNTQANIEALFFEGWTLIERKELANDQEPIFRGELIFKKSWIDKEVDK